MIELSLLGPHVVRGPDGREITSLPAQPKRFALLAYLALGSGGYRRRDTLAAMFWPDLDQFAARRGLRHTLYHLREALGDGVIVTRGDDAVSINAAMLTSDVTRLGEAVDAGRHEDAVAAYRGELLAGIHFANAGEAFEEWLSGERLRVSDLVLRAVTALVERDEQADNFAGAAYWAQRACSLMPGDEHWLRRAMTLLDRGSDTGGALRLYDAYARRLAADFDATPSAESQALAARVRDGTSKPIPSVRVVPPAAPAPAASTDSAPRVPPAPAVISATPSPSALRTGYRRRVAIGGGALVAIIAIAIAAARLTGARAAGAVAGRKRVLVAVFDNRTGDTTLQSLGRMTQDWIAQGMLRMNLVDLVDPRAVFVQGRTATGAAVDPVTLARRTGAAMVISGSYYRTADTLLLQASVLDVHAGRIVRVVGPIRSSVATPIAGLDDLRSRVMTALSSVIDVRATQDLRDVDEIPTYDAYEAYVEGWDTYWHGKARQAETLFLRAAHQDTAFAAASIAASVAAANSNDCRLVDSIIGALNARQRVIDRVNRLSMQIATAHCRGQNDEVLRLAVERADLESNTSADKLSVAAAALWAGRPQLTVTMLQRLDPAVDLAWSTDTTHFDYWSDLTEALHVLGRHREELAAADRAPLSAPLNRTWMRARALAALGRPTVVLALLDSAMQLPFETAGFIGLAPFTNGRPQYSATPAWVAVWAAHELAVHGDTVAARQAAMRAVAWYRGRPPEDRSTIEERLVAAWSLETLGNYAAADAMTAQLVVEDSTNVDFRGELAGLAAERGDTVLADSLDRWLAAQPLSRVGWSASVYRARVAELLGRRDAAAARVREARDDGAWPLWIHVDSALALLHRGR
ncbi:MAG TPA: BTAD domain-containing putative transcriptional regulator [Gemmatimonadales bacterium]|jgi:DNA-binding SARP family transcriptional activator/TolB-like protein